MKSSTARNRVVANPHAAQSGVRGFSYIWWMKFHKRKWDASVGVRCWNAPKRNTYKFFLGHLAQHIWIIDWLIWIFFLSSKTHPSSGNEMHLWGYIVGTHQKEMLIKFFWIIWRNRFKSLIAWSNRYLVNLVILSLFFIIIVYI